MHCVVALHRIAKSVDHRELRGSKQLTQQLAALAAKVAQKVQGEQVKEVSKALSGCLGFAMVLVLFRLLLSRLRALRWALAKVGPWSDSMEGYAPRGDVDWGRGWASVHKSLKVGPRALGSRFIVSYFNVLKLDMN